MAELTPQEKEKILKAREALKTEQSIVQENKEKQVEDALNRKHGKFLFVSSVVAISCLILFCVIMLTLLLSGENGATQLMHVSSFYSNFVRLLVLNLDINSAVINGIAIILSIATLITGIIVSSKMIAVSRQSITNYLCSTATIILNIVVLTLLSLMTLFTILKIFNFILILVLAGFVFSIVFAILDLVKTKRLYKSENTNAKK